MTRSGTRSTELLLKGQAARFHRFHQDQPITMPGEQSSPSDPTLPQHWPSPQAMDGERRGRIDTSNPRNGLTARALAWPTPTARVSGDGETPTTWDARNNRGAIRGAPLTITALRHSGTGCLLNPRFVEWLMGLPTGWVSLDALNCERSATA